MRLLVGMILLISSNVAYSFNWDNCYGRLKEKSKHWAEGLLTTTYGSSEFTSSTGVCSMIGLIEHDKKVFLAQNIEQLKLDSARGGGEYIEAYAYLSGCNQRGKDDLPRLLQENFKKIYGAGEDKELRDIYEDMEKVISTTPAISSNCKIKT